MSINHQISNPAGLAIARVPVTIQDLPSEVLGRIFCYLTTEELQKSVRINQLFHQKVIQFANRNYRFLLKDFVYPMIKLFNPPTKSEALASQALIGFQDKAMTWA